MEKTKRFNLFQKGVLIFMIVMALVFAVIYPMTISRVGFSFKDKILVPKEENGSVVYSGKLIGEQARFTVSPDKSVVFWHGDKMSFAKLSIRNNIYMSNYIFMSRRQFIGAVKKQP